MTNESSWHKAAEPDELPDRRVKTVTIGTTSIALTHYDGQYAAMENRCPHQGGPLGEGSIEEGVDGKCWLRCPWHGWDFDPLTGKPPGGHDDSGQRLYLTEVRDDGIYIAVDDTPTHERTTTDVMAETMVNWGRRTRNGPCSGAPMVTGGTPHLPYSKGIPLPDAGDAAYS